MNICCIGAGYVGGPTMSVIAKKCPHVCITVVDIQESRIQEWNSEYLPVFEPGLEAIVFQQRGKNLFFSTDVQRAIQTADLIFICVPTPTKLYGCGAGYTPDMQYVEGCARQIQLHAKPSAIIIEKSTVPVRTAQSIKRILNGDLQKSTFQILSNPEFLAEGTAIRDLENPDRVLIGCENNEAASKAAAVLSHLYGQWIAPEKIITTNLWSAELSKLAANAFLAQRISSINALSALCEATGADVEEIAHAVGADSRIRPKFLKASVGFGGSCFQKDILNLVYLCEHFGLSEVAHYWNQVVVINNYQKNRFIKQIFSCLFNTLSNKKITILGFAYKKDTNDTRDSAAIDVCKGLLAERASLSIYDPKVTKQAILMAIGSHERSTVTEAIAVHTDVYEATHSAHAIVILTEWDSFRELDFKVIYAHMQKPAFIFDGRNLLDLKALEAIGFKTIGIGKGDCNGLDWS